LNQIAPPLLLLAIPQLRVGRRSRGEAALVDLLLDPWAATTLFIGLSIAVSLPGVFDPSVANALYAAPLGVLELLSGLLFWAQFMPATRRIEPAWLAGGLAWVGAMPMSVVALIWMLSPEVLYTPYLNVICRWNIPPLLDQRWAGLLMSPGFARSEPPQTRRAWSHLSSLEYRTKASHTILTITELPCAPATTALCLPSAISGWKARCVPPLYSTTLTTKLIRSCKSSKDCRDLN
jgi:hypothetical protein